jgi:hypothetical protein
MIKRSLIAKLAKRIKDIPAAPCTVFDCYRRARCREQFEACYAFVSFVRTGRASPPHPMYEPGATPPTSRMIPIYATREIYSRVMADD